MYAGHTLVSLCVYALPANLEQVLRQARNARLITFRPALSNCIYCRFNQLLHVRIWVAMDDVSPGRGATERALRNLYGQF